MSNPVSILLIVGSAVLGPIEAQKSIPEIGPAPGRNICGAPLTYLDGTPGDCVRTRRYETLPELCERAMGEIGAVPWPADPTKHVLTNDDPEPGYTHFVRCIPVPQGYRR